MLQFSNAVLEEVYKTKCVKDAQGTVYPIDGVVSIPHANALYRAIKTFKPHTVLEIGMAYGASTLSILTALTELDANGTLVSIDPAQSTYWHNVGVENVRRSGMAKRHTLIEKHDFVALPNLLKDALYVDFAYIDGWHTFDYTLLDFFYMDKMLKVGGVVAFNDCSMPAVKKALNFVRTHRKYKELKVGITPSYLSRDLKKMTRLVLTGTSKQDRYFQKIEHWEPNWDFYARF